MDRDRESSIDAEWMEFVSEVDQAIRHAVITCP